MRPVMLLARLNEIDLTIDSLKVRLAEIAEALKEPAELRAARQASAEAESELMRCRTIQQDRELAQQQAAEKLAKAERSLYSGKVRDPKELQDSERDVQQLRRQHGRAEDSLLEALIATETASALCAERQTTLAELTSAWEARQSTLRAEQTRLKERLPAEQARQLTVRRAVPAQLLPLYDSLRARRGGRAVAELEDDVCSACLVAVPPTKLEAARYGEELVYCGNCGRLLWGE